MSDGFSGKYSLDPHHWQGGVWGKQIYEFQNNHKNPLTCTLHGVIFRPDNHFFTDMGSIPLFLQTKVPGWFAKDRFPRAYIFHDSSYRHSGAWVATEGGWQFIQVSRKQADQMLYHMILLEGGSKAAANLVWTGVRMGGWASFGKKQSQCDS